MGLMQKQFADLITFTRSTGGGRRNAQGEYEWLPANTPRIDYDPVTGECLGLLIEEQRTNLLAFSNKPSLWSSPLGLIYTEHGAYKHSFVEGDGSGWHIASHPAVPVTVGAQYTLSLKIEAVGGLQKTRVRLGTSGSGGTIFGLVDINFASESITSSNGASSARATFEGGIARLVIPLAPATHSTMGVGFYSGDVEIRPSNPGQGFILSELQLEPGSSSSSYIPTTDAQVTCAPDIATVNELSPWYNPEQGTLFVEWVQPAVKVGQQNVFDLNDGTTSNRIAGLIESKSSIFQSRYASGGSILPNRSAPPAVPGTICRAALSYSDGAQEFAFNGAIFGTGAFAGTLGLVSAMRIGGGLGGQLNSHIRSIRYFPRRLSDTELQALTA
ncbi:phage head spike fiber domain-containing protein [Stutzerimonas xanthomarina]|uniref:phage head spike fiber domain-containing protein n=1 Tax=Stutzerimonas xanthomarina TaxID=271420 RepID=UPI003AA9D445